MTGMNRRYLLITIVVMVFSMAGCSKDHLDPTQIGRFRPAPAVNVILDSLGVAEETANAYEGAEDPMPEDVLNYKQDYMFSSGDIIRITIFELLQEGAPYIDYFIVNESGNISVPEIGQIQAAGLTETQLEDEIRNSLSPGILKNPSVTVVLQSSVSRVFTIIGDGVTSPGRYNIPRSDFRLLDALAVAESARQFNVSYIYVARRLTGQEQPADELDIKDTVNLRVAEPEQQEVDLKLAEPEQQEVGLKPIEPEQQEVDLKPIEPEQKIKNTEKRIDLPQDDDSEEMLELIRPVFSTASSTGLVIASAEMATEGQLKTLAVPETMGDFDRTNNTVKVGDVISGTQQDRIEWTFQDGKWIPVRVGDSKTQEPQQQVDSKPQLKPQLQRQEEAKQAGPEIKAPPKDYGWEDIQSAGIGTRVIRIPKDRLYGGDPRYNIIIRPQDTITVQLDVVGEFYVLGNVNYQGVINMTGRPMTLKMAIAAAGGLGQLAWPKKCEVIRRVGEKKEEIVMVDLEKIANGTQPDFFIKPNDVINVGTHGISRYLLGLREAFTAYYGFGFMYQRNFADRDQFTHRPIPVDWFGL